MKAKKSKQRKFSLGIKIASMLSCVAILSVGFASWWIINLPKQDATQTGSFEVYTVTVKNIDFGTPTAENIVFGYKSGVTETWLGADKYDASSNPNGVKEEKLTATIKIPVTLKDDNDTKLNEKFSDYMSSFTVTLDTSALNNMDAGFVSTPTIKYSTDGNTYNTMLEGNKIPATAFDSYTDGEITIYLQVAFNWGTATGGKNPYEFFNGSGINSYDAYQAPSGSTYNATSGATYSDVAAAMLNAINDLSNATYTVTVHANK